LEGKWAVPEVFNVEEFNRILYDEIGTYGLPWNEQIDETLPVRKLVERTFTTLYSYARAHLWHSSNLGIFSSRLANLWGLIYSNDTKICSFNCIIALGWTLENSCWGRIHSYLEQFLKPLKINLLSAGEKNSVMTASLFPGTATYFASFFGEIIDGLLLVRKRYYPDAAITCLPTYAITRQDVP
jgi:hypothetical protein